MSAWRRAALAAEILAAYVSARRRLRHTALPVALAGLRGPARAVAAPDAVATGRGLGRAVARTLAILPAESRCLVRALVLTRLLARRGIDSRLVIAVRPGERFAAHAWVEHGGEPLLPPGAPAFSRLVSL